MGENDVMAPPSVILNHGERRMWLGIHAGHLVVALSLNIPMLCIMSDIKDLQQQGRVLQIEQLSEAKKAAEWNVEEQRELLGLKTKLAAADLKIDILLEQTKPAPEKKDEKGK